LLAWGRNFMGFTDFFIDYIPMYNKFRAVSSALVIAEFTIPLLAILTLKEIFDRPQILKEKIKYLYLSFGLTGGFALLFALAPRLFFSTFVPTQELKALQQAIPGDQLSPLLSNLEEMRVYLITSDAWRSFFIIAIGTALLLAYSARKLKATWTIAAIAVLCLGDMWMVNKRYLNDEQFVSADQQTEAFSKTTADELILQDSTLDYRVLNFATNTFNENNTAYWHKSVGGYHAAKLRRYQEMIDHHITKEMQAAYNEIATAQGKMDSVNGNSFRVLNMLNTKYFIFPSGKGKVAPIENPYAYGNAWFVGNVRYVNTANEEIEAIDSVLLTETAIVDASFKDKLKGITNSYKDSLSAVRLTDYKPNHLVYETSSSKDGIVVFSEIYYPGWTATIDGKPAEIARANYILRAMNIPAGKHTIEMAFDPKSIHVTESIAYAGLALLLVGIILLLLKYRKNFDLGKK